MKRLYLSETDKKVSGVCGGIAAYMETDSTVVRLLVLVLVILSGVLPGLVAYFISAIIMPKPPVTHSTQPPVKLAQHDSTDAE